MRLVYIVLIAVVLLLMVLEVLVQHSTVSVLLLLHVPSDLVLWMGGRLNVMLNIMVLFVGNAMLNS